MVFASPRVCVIGNGFSGMSVGRGRVLRGAGEGWRCRLAVGCRAAADEPYVGMNENVEDLPLPEGDIGLPVLGNTFEIVSCPVDFVRQRIKRYGPIYKTKFLGVTAINVHGVDEIQQIIRKEKELLDHSPNVSVQALLGDGALFTCKGAEHARLRQILNPVFSPTAVDGYIPEIVRRAEQECKEWANGGSILLLKKVKRYTFGVLAVAISQFNMNGKPMDEVIDLFNIYWDGMFSFGINLPFTTFGKSMKARKELLNIIDGEIDSLGSTPHHHGGKSLLKRLLEAEDDHGRKLSRAQVKDIMLNLVMAGYDTTSSVIIFIMMELAKNGKIWEKLRHEQREVISLFGSEITPKAINSMPYLDAVVQEGVRMTPLVALQRKAAKTFEINGYKVPKGWTVSVNTGTTGRFLDPRWHNLDEFCPERYFTPNGKKQEEAFAPFGLGVRTCIGKEIAKVEAKILFAVLARSYKLFLDSPTPKMRYSPVPEPVDDLPGRLERI